MSTEVTPGTTGKRLTATAELPALIERAGAVILERAKSITIRSDEDKQAAEKFGVDARDERNRLDADRLKQTKKMREAVDETNEYFRVPISLFEQAIEVTRQKINDWNAERKRIFLAEQKKLEDARKAKEEEARKEREAAQEKARLEEEERRKAAEAETARAQAAEKAALAAKEAAEATARGATEEAAAAVAAAETAQQDAAAARANAVAARKAQLKAEAETDAANERAAEAAKQVATAVPVGGMGGGLKVKGVRTTWKWKVKDGATVPPSHLTIDVEKVQGDVDRLKDRAGEVLPWLEVWSEESAQLRRR